jgi:5-(carboxyamino)imidazole ribonucleotide synthase
MRIGIIGAGQLGQMLGYAARDLNMQCTFVDPSAMPPAASCGEVIQAPFDDAAALAKLAQVADVVTYEFENVSVEALKKIAGSVPVYPPPAALRHAQDRLAEKLMFQSLGIPVPGFHPVDSRDDLEAAVAAIGLPLVLKTRRFGYDGKGQVVVRNGSELNQAWETLGGVALIAEAWVNFDFEVSAIGARNPAGQIISFPLTQNRHEQGILHNSRAPLDHEPLRQSADGYLHSLLEKLDYVGVLALELFVTGEQLLANEFAPRVHNSGHWTIEGATPSQFTAHLLAISGAELDPPQVHGFAGMLNLLGEIPGPARQQAVGTLHDYGKDPRPGRKLGHITVLAESAAERDRKLGEIEQTVINSTD